MFLDNNWMYLDLAAGTNISQAERSWYLFLLVKLHTFTLGLCSPDLITALRTQQGQRSAGVSGWPSRVKTQHITLFPRSSHSCWSSATLTYHTRWSCFVSPQENSPAGSPEASLALLLSTAGMCGKQVTSSVRGLALSRGSTCIFKPFL